MPDKKLCDYIQVNEEFQNSVNIEYDLHNINKIRNFIPTASSLKLIEEIVINTAENQMDRARLVVGAYGKGKSHMLLVLLALLCGKFSKGELSTVLERIKAGNENLYHYLCTYLDEQKKLLPVIIQGPSLSLNQSFLQAMQKALENEGLADLMPDTYFNSAIQMIENWNKNYQDTLKMFERLVNQKSERFIHRLENFDRKAYLQFVEVYPQLTSGAVFNPFYEQNVITLFEDINKSIKKYGYNGIFIVYDEFSKYLEGDIGAIPSTDTLLLQNFAESANRSKGQQMHIVLVTHKSIENYFESLPKKRIDGWKGVAERYRHIEIQNNYTQTYQLIARVIDNKSIIQLNDNKLIKKLMQCRDSYCQSDDFSFNELENEELTDLVINTFPLHVSSVFLLPRVSEKVAQNERTFITFLSAKSKNTLWSFIKEKTIYDFITPDYMYDYFEPLFKREPYNTPIYQLWKKTELVLNQIDTDHLESKIIKALSLIYIVNQFDKMEPTIRTINNMFFPEYSMTEIAEAITNLRDKKYILYQFKSNHYLRLKENSGINVQELVDDTANIIKNKISVIDIIKTHNSESYIYPTSYNDNYEVIRYFKVMFMDSQDFYDVENWEKKIENIDSDGAVCVIIPHDEEDRELVCKYLINNYQSKRIVFVVGKGYIKIIDDLYEYSAVTNLLKENQNDPTLIQELEIIKEDNEIIINRYINSLLMPEQRQASYFWNSKPCSITRRRQLTEQLSKISSSTYKYYPIIKNELINKNVITTAVKNARNRVVNALLEPELKPNLGLTGHGQEITIMRSLLINPEILINIDDKVKINIEDPKTNKFGYCLLQIKKFFLSSNKSSLFDLYKQLTLPSGKIGLKKGVIPVYIACVLSEMNQQVTFYHAGAEIEINANALNYINDAPEEYTCSMLDWDQDKEEYLNDLASMFVAPTQWNKDERNSFYSVINGMQHWFIALPKYTKELKNLYLGKEESVKVEKEIIRIKNLLRQNDINPREFLFEKLPNALSVEVSEYKTIVTKLRSVKLILDQALECLEKSLMLDVEFIFKENGKEEWSLASVLHEWYEKLPDFVKNHLFENGEDRVLNCIAQSTNDKHIFIEKMSKELIGLRIEDWTEDKISLFLNDLITFKEKVEAIEKEHNISNNLKSGNGTYFIGFLDNKGNKLEKTFDRVMYTQRAVLLKNEVENAIDEMGSSISENEKRQVIVEILEKLCR